MVAWAMTIARERLDVLLVRRGLAPSRPKAQAMIMAGDVVVDQHRVDKPGMHVPIDADIRLKRPPDTYVGRGAHKLLGAFDDLGIVVRGCIALDVGASTGGFTQALLERGAILVHALDVGHNQLAWQLRQDPRVKVYEGVNFRYYDPRVLEPRPNLATVDVSFISLELMLPVLAQALAPGAHALVLVKPQFELGPQAVGKGGVVHDPALRAQAVQKVVAAAMRQGFRVVGAAESRVHGTEGNVETFLHLVRDA